MVFICGRYFSMIPLFSQMAGTSPSRMKLLYLLVLGLHVLEIVPRLVDNLLMQQNVEHGHRLHLRSGHHALMRDRRRHRHSVRPVVAGTARDVRRIPQRYRRNHPGHVADIVGPSARRLTLTAEPFVLSALRGRGARRAHRRDLHRQPVDPNPQFLLQAPSPAAGPRRTTSAARLSGCSRTSSRRSFY